MKFGLIHALNAYVVDSIAVMRLGKLCRANHVHIHHQAVKQSITVKKMIQCQSHNSYCELNRDFFE